MADISDFVKAPSEDFLNKCTKEQLLKIADHFEIDISDRRLKDTVKSILTANLTEMGVLAGEPVCPPEAGFSPPFIATSNFTFEQQKEVLKLQLEHDKMRQVEIEKHTPDSVSEPVKSKGEVSDSLYFSLSDVPLSASQEELKLEQRADPSLEGLFDMVLPEDEVKNNSHGYFLLNELLVRKWVPHGDDFVGDPIIQIVVPVKFRESVLKLAHDESGHWGVKKTYNRVLRHFFWPRLKRDVASHLKTCHTCQLIGKPNQSVKPAPLLPIPAINQPFEHLIIDCVGPLPRSRSGAVYLLTVMCRSTRFPAAYPLRTITARSVVRALSQFISIFGIPKVIQSDQGSNFTSKLFSQVLKQLHIKHNKAREHWFQPK